MSVQNYPRIYFNGHFEANPATGNNNDYFFESPEGKAVTYLGGRVELNWDLIGQPKPTVDSSNQVSQAERKAIREWFITLREDTDNQKQLPGEWNYYGGNQASFVQFEGDESENKPPQLTSPVGGALGPTEPVTSDPFLENANVFLVGDGHSKKSAFAGPPSWPTASEPGPASRLVDVDPLSTWSTQIFYRHIFIGKPGCGIVMNRSALFQLRYYLGWATWQTAVEKGPQLRIENPEPGAEGHSALLAAFQEALEQDNIKGLIFSFNTLFLSSQDAGGIGNPPEGGGRFNNAEFPYAKYEGQQQLAELYKNQLKWEFSPPGQGPKIGLYCPAYPTAVGTIGVWREDEALRSAPQGRYLLNKKIEPNTPYGFIVASISRSDQPEDGGWLHLSSQNQTSFIGTLNIGLAAEDGSFESVLKHDLGSPLDISQGAIVDIKLKQQQAEKLEAGRMEFQLQAPASVPGSRHPSVNTYVFKEQELVANTDQRSIYSDAGGTSSLDAVTIAVTNRGKPAPKDTAVLVVKYRHFPSPNVAPVIVSKSDGEQTVELTDSNGTSIEQTIPFSDNSGGAGGETLAAIVHTDADGLASLSVRSLDDGFAILLFLPFTGEQPPTPTSEINPQILSYTCLRIWPNDTPDKEAFVKVWNDAIGQGKVAVCHASWKFVYENVLYLYDLLYPVMLFLPLYDLEKIETSIAPLIHVLDVEFENTMLMPVTRDLSTGKHWVLRKWAGLVQAGYPLNPISVDA